MPRISFEPADLLSYLTRRGKTFCLASDIQRGTQSSKLATANIGPHQILLPTICKSTRLDRGVLVSSHNPWDSISSPQRCRSKEGRDRPTGGTCLLQIRLLQSQRKNKLQSSNFQNKARHKRCISPPLKCKWRLFTCEKIGNRASDCVTEMFWMR